MGDNANVLSYSSGTYTAGKHPSDKTVPAVCIFHSLFFSSFVGVRFQDRLPTACTDDKKALSVVCDTSQIPDQRAIFERCLERRAIGWWLRTPPKATSRTNSTSSLWLQTGAF